MSENNPRISYPISSTVLIDYLMKSRVFPIFMGTDFISFSTIPFLGGKKLPVHIDIKSDVSYNRNAVDEVLKFLELSINDFEDNLQF